MGDWLEARMRLVDFAAERVKETLLSLAEAVEEHADTYPGRSPFVEDSNEIIKKKDQ